TTRGSGRPGCLVVHAVDTQSLAAVALVAMGAAGAFAVTADVDADTQPDAATERNAARGNPLLELLEFEVQMLHHVHLPSLWDGHLPSLWDGGIGTDQLQKGTSESIPVRGFPGGKGPETFGGCPAANLFEHLRTG